MRDHLKRATLIIVAAVIVVVAHQIFVLANYPTRDWHSLVHIALLTIAVSLGFSAWIIRTSYLKLQEHQKAVLDAYVLSEQLGARTGDNLRKSESLLESLFGAITDRILVIDKHNRIVKANKIAATWAGRAPVDYDFTEIFPTCASLGERRNELNLIEFTRATQESQRGRLLQGGVDCTKLLSVDTYPVSHQDDDSTLVITIARDVTEQTGREYVSRHREKMAALGLLVAGFAHDLGNPLASLSCELELLREENPGKICGSLDTLSEHVERIKRKLHDIVEFARRPNVDTLGADARKAIDHAHKLTRCDPRALRIQFNIDVNDDLPPLQMKEDDLVLVLVNLIVNAFDAMPQGGELSLNASMTPAGEALLTVADTGVGMHAATLQQATLPLFTTKCVSEATGLGLTMANQLIGLAGGELTLASEPGGGSRIMLRIPVVTGDHPVINPIVA